MTTELIPINSNYDYAIKRAINVLQSGGLFVFPTDTVYGLGCVYNNENAVRRIYELKGREFNKPLAAYFSSVNMAEKYIEKQGNNFYDICRKYLPGALTIVVTKNEIVPDYVTSSTNTLGIRIPDSKFIIDLIENLGVPFVGTSANISNFPSAISAEQARGIFGNRIELILEDDQSISGLESTVMSIVGNQYQILRQGAVIIV